MLVIDRPRLQANKYVIAARWFYVLGLFLVGWLTKFGLTLIDLPEDNLRVIFIGAFFTNLLLWALAERIDSTGSRLGVEILSYLQIIVDLVLLTLLLYLVGGVFSIIPVLFLIPIVESVVLFDIFGPALLAIVSGILMLVWAFVKDYSGAEASESLVPSVGRAFSLAVVYLIIGIFSSYIAKLLRERGDLYAERATQKQNELTSLQKLNQELEKKTKALEAKELELTLANKRLETLEQAKSKFVAVTTHQLRTPLAAIKWTFNMLIGEQLGPINDEQKKFINQGSISTEKMITIVNDLLNIDKIETAQSDNIFAPIELIPLLEEILYEFATQTESKKIKLNFSKPEKSLPVIEADKQKVSMVLENLIDNAIKYTKEGGEVSVTVSDSRLNASQPTIEIIIQDTGVGIAPEDQKKIFSKFYRAPNAISTEPDGSGLGLFIAKDIIQKHGGAIWFESQLDKGTAFHITLPLKPQVV